MESRLEELKRYVGLVAEDSVRLAALSPLAEPRIERLIGRFYEKIQEHDETRRVLTSAEQAERLRQTLAAWVRSLLAGPHDEAYYASRSRIGRIHVRVGLPQAYMFAAMNVMRDGLTEIAREGILDDRERSPVLHSLNKMLDLELAMMLETYREESLEQLQRSEQQAALKRLADIGAMAATVAHEVRNPLAGISGAIEVLRDDLAPDSPRHEVIREILAQVRRLDEHVRDLLLYARRNPPRPEPVDVADLLHGTLRLLSEEPLMRHVRATVDTRGDLTFAMDRGQIQEALVNLIRNAARAMQGRGEIFLEARLARGGALELVVEDTGPGIPKDRVEDAFRPFFSTWPEGTGLGLSICQKTLQAHGGSLSYEEGRQGGARFVARFPRTEPSP